MTTTPLAVEALFLGALELPDAERAAFIERSCAGDLALKDRVERLLAAHHKTVAQRFLEPPTVPARPNGLRPAARLGRYAILDELGRGGMGVVYAAFDPDLARKIAVKLVLGDTSARLESEARALARLQHPNVVAVHDVGRQDNQIYIAMELVEGEPLSTWAKTHDSLAVLRVLVAAGHGLAHAHHEGILHRDFKPANVLVDKTGRARVADFGLAVDREVAPYDASVMGTPGFMAPEIESGLAASIASDVFAYCHALATLMLDRADTPPWLVPLVQRGLADAPGDRWPDLDTLLAAIERELDIDPKHDPRRGRVQRRRVYALIAALVVLVPMLAGLATGTSVSKLDLDVVFLITLVPLVGAGVVAFAFRASMMATEFNRRGIESMLLVAFAISANHGLTLRLAHDATIVFCTDLVIVAGFLFGTAVYARDRLMAVAAAVALTGAAAIASAPAQAAPIFAIATATLLPFLYFHWTSKGAS